MQKPFRPSARLALRVEAQASTRIALYQYGEDDRVPNPGDVLLVSIMGDGREDRIEFAQLLRGKDIALVAKAMLRAQQLYALNEDWLTQPVSRRVSKEEWVARMGEDRAHEYDERIPADPPLKEWRVVGLDD